jgi:hypothetical protein
MLVNVTAELAIVKLPAVDHKSRRALITVIGGQVIVMMV